MIPFHGESIIQALKRINVPILYIQATQAQWPEPKESIQLLKQCNPNFEMEKIDGPHHLHMTHVDRVSESVEKFIHKYVNRTEETAKL
ncbi:unnamed protein product [Didymodactylos carnosus]|uniref:Uncharacterized protein n=1 Tax=Didymodactylos carnosus TaxID=1234261 RepID=A0A813TJT6_9BILA|nr:unnamed protein product [Didymodactylos carnosus]CAF3598570.1 unnamed protein product [Didymodactylos carnosus]CAF4502168.1 unnamed protein product [Didymodactylos carnosus]